jgi:hypothetical protein
MSCKAYRSLCCQQWLPVLDYSDNITMGFVMQLIITIISHSSKKSNCYMSHRTINVFCCCCLAVLVIKPRVPCMPGKCSTTKLHPQPRTSARSIAPTLKWFTHHFSISCWVVICTESIEHTETSQQKRQEQGKVWTREKTLRYMLVAHWQSWVPGDEEMVDFYHTREISQE